MVGDNMSVILSAERGRSSHFSLCPHLRCATAYAIAMNCEWRDRWVLSEFSSADAPKGKHRCADSTAQGQQLMTLVIRTHLPTPVVIVPLRASRPLALSLTPVPGTKVFARRVMALVLVVVATAQETKRCGLASMKSSRTQLPCVTTTRKLSAKTLRTMASKQVTVLSAARRTSPPVLRPTRPRQAAALLLRVATPSATAMAVDNEGTVQARVQKRHARHLKLQEDAPFARQLARVVPCLIRLQIA